MLESRASLAIDLKRQDCTMAKLLLDVIMCSTEENSRKEFRRREGCMSLTDLDLAFAIYHLLVIVAHTVEQAVGNVSMLPKEAEAVTAGVENETEASHKKWRN